MKNIRRKDREITTQEACKLLESAEYGVLSTVDESNQPYGVPLNYVYKNDCIYFHCALSGHKLNNLKVNEKVSFCVVGNTRVLPIKFSAEYESAVVFGVATEAFDAERHDALLWFLEKYSPGFIEEGKQFIKQHDKATKVIKINISNISGKART